MNAELAVGAEVIGFEEKGYPDGYIDTEDDPGEGRDIHFYTLTTTGGAADVTLHVDHNGYYGGRLDGPFWVDP